MANTLETWSWIAAVVAVPVAVVLSVIGWFVSAKRKTNKSVASTDGTAISGDVHAGTAGIVTGHNSPVSLKLILGNETGEKTPLLRERWDVTAITLVARYLSHHEPDEVTIPCQSLSLFDAEVKTEYDAGGIPRYSRVTRPAFILAADIDLSVISKITWNPQQILFTDSKTGKQKEFFLIHVDIINQLDTAKFFING